MPTGMLHTAKAGKNETYFIKAGPLVQLVACLTQEPGPEVIKLFICSTQLSMNFFLLINVKMPTIVGILTFMSRKNSILDLSEPKKSRIS